jgi:hypothetical protein
MGDTGVTRAVHKKHYGAGYTGVANVVHREDYRVENRGVTSVVQREQYIGVISSVHRAGVEDAE